MCSVALGQGLRELFCKGSPGRSPAARTLRTAACCWWWWGASPLTLPWARLRGCCCCKRSGPMEKCTGAGRPPTQAWLVEVGRRRGTVVRSFRPDVFTGAHGLRFREVAREMRRLQQLKHKWVAGPAPAVRGLGGALLGARQAGRRWAPAWRGVPCGAPHPRCPSSAPGLLPGTPGQHSQDNMRGTACVSPWGWLCTCVSSVVQVSFVLARLRGCAPSHLVQRWAPILAPPAENTSLSPMPNPLCRHLTENLGMGAYSFETWNDVCSSVYMVEE